MTAELLREASSEMRRDAGLMDHRDHVFLHAVADWLDVLAAELEHQDHSDAWEPYEAALAVAHAYLGEQP